jgi:hypothetical protein
MPNKVVPRVAAGRRDGPSSVTRRFSSRADVEQFFSACDVREGLGVEPDWEEHLAVINESRSRGVPTPATRISAWESRHER